jgi:fluoroacetyl-CoA thioesterase
MELSVGAKERVELTVTDADTAVAHGSGDVAVLATPQVVALAERATVAAIADGLSDATTTVGTRVEVAHTAATPVGRTVVAEATLVALDGRRLTFDVIVYDGETVAARGQVERALVDRDRFMQRAVQARPPVEG